MVILDFTAVTVILILHPPPLSKAFIIKRILFCPEKRISTFRSSDEVSPTLQINVILLSFNASSLSGKMYVKGIVA